MTETKMISAKQLAANRRNAQKSTGPRRPEGKAVSRYNALKHGILGKAVIPKALEPYESRETYEALLADLKRDFAPANTVENLLVEEIAACQWR